MDYNRFIVLMPALDPNRNMIRLLSRLMQRGFTRIVIVDDGSKASQQKYFDEAALMGCCIAHHPRRKGKGKALRTALHTADQWFGDADFYITVDCDGQHTPDDVEKVAQEMLANPDHFVLGVRKFEKTEGKKVSYWVNYYQRMFFRVTNNGLECPDPRSGLRAFPSALKELALSTEGRSYDYELNFLDSAFNAVETSLVPISAETFTHDETSHFRPVIDLLGMYLKFWRYLITSNISTVFDLIFFAVFEWVFKGFGAMAIFAATVCARILSGLIGYILNRFISFKSRMSAGSEMVRYGIVFIGQMAASGLIVSLLDRLPIPTILIKAVVDFILFFVVYSLQKNWVFAVKTPELEGPKIGDHTSLPGPGAGDVKDELSVPHKH